MTDRKTDVRFPLRVGWFAVFGATLLVCCFPIKNGLLRLYFIVAVPALFIAAVILLWHRKYLRLVPLVILGIILIALVIPGRGHNPERLRMFYVASLRSYEGTRYIWGGENGFGIDCSGLVRNGLINAHIHDAFLGANPRGFRHALELWWYDCSARALKSGYREWARPLFTADSVNEIDLTLLAPGDLAVTSDGIHVMAYLGMGEWIEADPGLGKVFKGCVPVRNKWFERPVSVIRWKILEGSDNNTIHTDGNN